MIQKMGNNSMLFEKPPVILAASSVVGEKEGQGPLGQYFDHVEKDPKFGAGREYHAAAGGRESD